MEYDDLLVEADKIGLIVKEKRLLGNDGRILGNKVAIRCNMSLIQKKCVLAEEMGHYEINVGNILDQNIISNRKQEKKARIRAYNRLFTLDKVISAYLAGCRNKYEIAEHMDITEEFFEEALKELLSKKGPCFKHGDYIIYLEPCFGILKFYQ
ncbi:ImmA/IrrE family metallo-endopeptidase [Lachnoclostridium sp.]|uniref:ImmA/IrrE family metallo-endopeptidase n=1 Tax=Lachnoclostridium sp. TaxID=2028282 RepID=UPI0028964875|nr:ImmA/IrrE family metallo-endopeptidase [Lachnoclostridium sp.]